MEDVAATQTQGQVQQQQAPAAAAAAASAPLSHFDNCMAQGHAYKAAGNAAFQAGELQRALAQYARVGGCVNGLEVPAAFGAGGEGGLGLLAQGLRAGVGPQPLTEAQRSELHALQASATLNRAACYARPGPLQSWQKVYELASQVLARDPGHPKALFRRAQATMSQVASDSGAAEAAKKDLTMAAVRAPGDAGIAALLAQANKILAQQAAADERKLRAQFANMFSK